MTATHKLLHYIQEALADYDVYISTTNGDTFPVHRVCAMGDEIIRVEQTRIWVDGSEAVRQILIPFHAIGNVVISPRLKRAGCKGATE